MFSPISAGRSPAHRLMRWLAVIGAAAACAGAPSGAERSQPAYWIETLAGTGMPGDLPTAGGAARETPVDLPFGVENGPDGALYITTVGTHRVLRLDRKSGRLTSVAGN